MPLDALREIDHGKYGNQPNSPESRESRNTFRADSDYKFGETGESQNDVPVNTDEPVEKDEIDHTDTQPKYVSKGNCLCGIME